MLVSNLEIVRSRRQTKGACIGYDRFGPPIIACMDVNLKRELRSRVVRGRDLALVYCQ